VLDQVGGQRGGRVIGLRRRTGKEKRNEDEGKTDGTAPAVPTLCFHASTTFIDGKVYYWSR
jgi:hypothetical protein